MGLEKSRSSADSASGFSLIEVLIATLILAIALVSLAQLFAMSTRTNIGARNTTHTAVLAQQKVEELRSLTWGFDTQGLPISDTTTNTAVSPETPAGGTGLSPSPAGSLGANTDGYVDYVDQFGNKLGGGDEHFRERESRFRLQARSHCDFLVLTVTRRASSGRTVPAPLSAVPRSRLRKTSTCRISVLFGFEGSASTDQRRT